MKWRRDTDILLVWRGTMLTDWAHKHDIAFRLHRECITELMSNFVESLPKILHAGTQQSVNIINSR